MRNLTGLHSVGFILDYEKAGARIPIGPVVAMTGHTEGTDATDSLLSVWVLRDFENREADRVPVKIYPLFETMRPNLPEAGDRFILTQGFEAVAVCEVTGKHDD